MAEDVRTGLFPFQGTWVGDTQLDGRARTVSAGRGPLPPPLLRQETEQAQVICLGPRASQGQGWDLNTQPCPLDSNALTNISLCIMSEGCVKCASVISDSNTALQFPSLPADPGSQAPSPGVLSAPFSVFICSSLQQGESDQLMTISMKLRSWDSLAQIFFLHPAQQPFPAGRRHAPHARALSRSRPGEKGQPGWFSSRRQFWGPRNL